MLRSNKSIRHCPHFYPTDTTYCYYKISTKPSLFPALGRIVAPTVFMILVTIQMKVLAEKRKELSQTIALLIGSIKTEKGCRRCDFCRSMEDENRFFLFEEWDTREDFDSHLKSACFTVLRGTLNLLQEPCEMVFHTVAGGKS